jgi:hypothetical protein
MIFPTFRARLVATQFRFQFGFSTSRLHISSSFARLCGPATKRAIIWKRAGQNKKKYVWYLIRPHIKHPPQHMTNIQPVDRNHNFTLHAPQWTQCSSLALVWMKEGPEIAGKALKLLIPHSIEIGSQSSEGTRTSNSWLYYKHCWICLQKAGVMLCFLATAAANVKLRLADTDSHQPEHAWRREIRGGKEIKQAQFAMLWKRNVLKWKSPRPLLFILVDGRYAWFTSISTSTPVPPSPGSNKEVKTGTYQTTGEPLLNDGKNISKEAFVDNHH